MGLESDSAEGERSAAAHRAMKNELPFMHEQGVFQCKMSLHELKNEREKRRLIARELCRNAKAILDSSVTITDVCGVLTSFLSQLRKNEVELRLLNKEIEPLIDIEDLDQEFTTNIDYEDEITHIMIRLYYRLKDKKCDTKEKCQIMETLHSSKNFNEFFTMTEQCYDPCDLETPAEHDLLLETSPQPDFPSQTGLENSTSSLSELDLETQGALLSRALKESAEMSTNKTGGRSSNLMTPAESPYGEYIKRETMDLEPGELQGQDTTQKGKPMHDAGERDECVFERYARKMAAAHIRQSLLKKTIHCRKHLNNKARHNENRITNVQNSRKQRKPPKHYFEIAANEPELTSGYKTVEDGLRILTWLRGLHRQTWRVLRRRPQ